MRARRSRGRRAAPSRPRECPAPSRRSWPAPRRTTDARTRRKNSCTHPGQPRADDGYRAPPRDSAAPRAARMIARVGRNPISGAAEGAAVERRAVLMTTGDSSQHPPQIQRALRAIFAVVAGRARLPRAGAGRSAVSGAQRRLHRGGRRQARELADRPVEPDARHHVRMAGADDRHRRRGHPQPGRKRRPLDADRARPARDLVPPVGQPARDRRHRAGLRREPRHHGRLRAVARAQGRGHRLAAGLDVVQDQGRPERGGGRLPARQLRPDRRRRGAAAPASR